MEYAPFIVFSIVAAVLLSVLLAYVYYDVYLPGRPRYYAEVKALIELISQHLKKSPGVLPGARKTMLKELQIFGDEALRLAKLASKDNLPGEARGEIRSAIEERLRELQRLHTELCKVHVSPGGLAALIEVAKDLQS